MKRSYSFITEVLPKNKTLPLIFFGSIIFEFLVALPVYYHLSKQIGIILIWGVAFIFVGVDIYFMFRFIRFVIRKRQRRSQ